MPLIIHKSRYPIQRAFDLDGPKTVSRPDFEYDEKLDDPEIFLDACYTEMPVDLDAHLWVLISTEGEVHEIDLTDDDDDDYDYDDDFIFELDHPISLAR